MRFQMTMLGSRWCRLRAILAAGTPSPVFSTCVVMGLLLFTEEPIAVNLKMHREIIILKRRILKKVAHLSLSSQKALIY